MRHAAVSGRPSDEPSDGSASPDLQIRTVGHRRGGSLIGPYWRCLRVSFQDRHLVTVPAKQSSTEANDPSTDNHNFGDGGSAPSRTALRESSSAPQYPASLRAPEKPGHERRPADHRVRVIGPVVPLIEVRDVRSVRAPAGWPGWLAILACPVHPLSRRGAGSAEMGELVGVADDVYAVYLVAVGDEVQGYEHVGGGARHQQR